MTPPTPEEHIEALISAGEEEGLIQKGDRELIQSVVAFGDKTVREVMTPRPNIVAIRQNASLEELRQLVIHEQFSRIPAYDADIDDITGFVHVRDMFEVDEEERKVRRVQDVMRPIRVVPESKPVNDLLREMQEEGAHMAVVVDEYGATAGIVTMEDMVEEIVGEIHDEHEPGARLSPGTGRQLHHLRQLRPGSSGRSSRLQGAGVNRVDYSRRAGDGVAWARALGRGRYFARRHSHQGSGRG